jgi:hypothetical protein
MEVLGTCTQLSRDELRKVNFCRMFLQVELLSDIMTADGKSIRRNIWNGIKDNCHENFADLYVNQPKPGNTAWATWRRALKINFLCNDYGTFSTQREPITKTVDWVWYYDTEIDRIYKHSRDKWDVYTRRLQGRHTRQQIYKYSFSTSNTENNSTIPITTYQVGDGIRIDGKGINNELHRQVNKFWCDSTNVQLVGEVQALVESLQTDPIIIMSDGSAPDSGASTAWIIGSAAGYGNNRYIKGKGKIPDIPCDSHRVECYGIMGGIATWKKYSELWNIPNNQSVIISCDNAAALNFSCNYEWYPYVTCKMPDFDLLASIRKMMVGVNFTFQHTKGHQELSVRPHTIFTTMNIHVDELAEDAMRRKWVQGMQSYMKVGRSSYMVTLRFTKI